VQCCSDMGLRVKGCGTCSYLSTHTKVGAKRVRARVTVSIRVSKSWYTEGKDYG